jgi:hypothetical protein
VPIALRASSIQHHLNHEVPMPGRHKILDDDKRSTICSLVASGVSLRQAANYIGCAPKSIRREIERNDEFRARLAKARSEARIHPLDTLRQAASSNWRAALAWMERLEPDRFANPTESIVTKREANRFVDELAQSIEEVVENPRQRRDLFDRLAAAMPTAMRRRWEGETIDRAKELIKHDVEERNRIRRVKYHHLQAQRNARRCKLFEELRKYLPSEISSKLWNQRDLLDPEEVFVQKPAASDRPDAAPAETSTTNSAPPGANNVPHPGRNDDHFAPPPPPKQLPRADMHTPGGAKSTA